MLFFCFICILLITIYGKQGSKMKLTNGEQVYHILQNLNMLEISYLEYSRSKKDFVRFNTYVEYFNNYVIRSHNLSRFYFPFPQDPNIKVPQFVSDLEEITEHDTILPGYDLAVSKNFNFPSSVRHKCNYFSLICLIEGRALLELDTESFNLHPGDFYLIPPSVYYSITSEQESICVFLDLRRSFVASECSDIFLEDATLTRFVHQSLEPDSSMTYLAIHTCIPDLTKELLMDLYAEYINQDKYSSHVMKHYLSLLFARILRDPGTKIESSVKVSRIDRHYQQLLDYLKQNYRTADLSAAASEIHFSRQYVCRIIREKTGDTFNTLLKNIRLEMVAKYLTDTDLSQENIAWMCGFSAASHMSRIFKERYNCTPSAYRREQRQTD